MRNDNPYKIRKIAGHTNRVVIIPFGGRDTFEVPVPAGHYITIERVLVSGLGIGTPAVGDMEVTIGTGPPPPAGGMNSSTLYFRHIPVFNQLLIPPGLQGYCELNDELNLTVYGQGLIVVSILHAVTFTIVPGFSCTNFTIIYTLEKQDSPGTTHG